VVRQTEAGCENAAPPFHRVEPAFHQLVGFFFTKPGVVVITDFFRFGEAFLTFPSWPNFSCPPQSEGFVADSRIGVKRKTANRIPYKTLTKSASERFWPRGGSPTSRLSCCLTTHFRSFFAKNR